MNAEASFNDRRNERKYTYIYLYAYAGKKTNKYDGHALLLNETRCDINMAVNQPENLYKKCIESEIFRVHYAVCMFLRSNKSTSQRARLFKA